MGTEVRYPFVLQMYPTCTVHMYTMYTDDLGPLYAYTSNETVYAKRSKLMIWSD